MPANPTNGLGSLEVIDAGVPAGFLAKLNDRLRRLSNEIASQSTTVNNTTNNNTTVQGGASELVLSVPGILATQSNVAPLVSFGSNTSFSMAVLLAKRPAQGGAIVAALSVNGAQWGPQMTLAAGAASASFDVSGAGAITANQVVRLDLLSVGATFPGSDLTVILR